MTNKFTVLCALFLVLTVGFGCSLLNKTTSGGGSSDNSGTTNSSEEAKTGVAECDEFIDLINTDSKKPDEDIITRNFREYGISIAKSAIKKNIEENKGDKQKIADGCRKAKDDYIKKRDDKNKDSNSNSAKSGDSQKF